MTETTNETAATFAVVIDKDPWTSMRETIGTLTMDDGTELEFSLSLSGTQLFVYSNGGGQPSVRANLKPLIERMGEAVCEQRAAQTSSK